jgi:hypothetical protein
MTCCVYISRDLFQVYGPRHRDVGFTWHDIGDVAMRAQRWQQAVAAFELAYSIRADALGDEDDETQQSKTALGEARAAMITTA